VGLDDVAKRFVELALGGALQGRDRAAQVTFCSGSGRLDG
jgi:hypothetical protein